MGCFIKDISVSCFCLNYCIMDIFLKSSILVVSTDRKLLALCMTILVSSECIKHLSVLISYFKYNTLDWLSGYFVSFLNDNLTDCLLILHGYLLDFCCLLYFKGYITCHLISIWCRFLSECVLSDRKSLNHMSLSCL